MINSLALLSLAPELLHRICMEMEMPGVKQLRLTCKEMAALLEPCIYRTLSLSVNKRNMHDGVKTVETLATSIHPAQFACRILSIGSLSPSYEPAYRLGMTDSPSQNLAEIAIAEEKLVTHLFKAITSLCGVQHITWIPVSKDGHSIYRIIMNSLKVLTSLRRLEIVFSDCDIPLELDDLRGLDEITISTRYTSLVKQALIMDNLAKAISQNPNLTSIHVSTSRHNRHKAHNTHLHQLLKYYPISALPLRLRNLRLEAFFIRFDEITMPHFAHLTSLILLDVDDRFGIDSIRDPWENPTDPALVEERKRYGSRTEDIWNALTAAGVRLEKIVIDNIPQSFLGYLSSYSGLKYLGLTYAGSVFGGFSNGESSDAMAAMFFEQLLNNHAGSLEIVNIPAAHEGLWCFGSHNQNSISKLTKLKRLGMSVRSSDLWDYRRNSQDKNSPKRDAIHNLVDMVVNYLPNITAINIHPAALESHRGVGGRTGRKGHLDRVYSAIKDSVENYASPSGCEHIPLMTIGTRDIKYVGERTQPSESEKNSVQSDGQAQGSGILKYVATASMIKG